jgi:hypothetical protein
MMMNTTIKTTARSQKEDLSGAKVTGVPQGEHGKQAIINFMFCFFGDESQAYNVGGHDFGVEEAMRAEEFS